jgi:hypothetical protein
MAGENDASIRNLYITEQNGTSPVEVLGNGKPFDIVADIEIGSELMEHIDKDTLFAFVRNVSRSSATPLPIQTTTRTPVRNPQPFRDSLRVKVGGGWSANEGDVLEAVATYKTTVGVDVDYSKNTSQQVVVTA